MIDHDDSAAARRQWRFTYMGEDLVPFVLRKLEQIQAGQKTGKRPTTRIGLARYLVSELEGYIHEFHRAPRRKFELSIQDVIFFGLADPVIEPALRRAAVALARKGGQKGGRARAAKLTPARRSAIARAAVKARWDKMKGRTKVSEG